MNRHWFGIAALLLGALNVTPFTHAGEIGWLEEFSLAADRTGPLKQLIPGTEDYYYYHCLHYQNTEQWAKVDETLKAWVDRHQWTARAIEIQNRQALLTYGKNPQGALDLIRNRLNLQFDHQREELNPKSDLPTKLDPALLARQRLNQDAFSRFPNTLEGFTDSALDWLVSAELNPHQRRQLLSRLVRPDHAGLVKLIVADLAFENSGGFGQFNIHRNLLLTQLDELLKLRPELHNQTNFVEAYVKRLHPSDDVNWRQDPKALAAYLDRLWAFAKTLDASHNSLKAHVLYHRLVLDRSQGKPDLTRLIEYLLLPKHAVYVEPKFMQPAEQQRAAANLQQDYSGLTLLPPIGDDEPLVRSYLMQFFIDADDNKLFAPYVNDLYLKRLFAETKIVNGLGDAEKWYALLPPAEYQQLKERIDLEFADTNKTELGPDDPVGLDLYVKNVDTLIVKVFEINTRNYYRENLKEVDTVVNLDGLVATEEKTYAYKEPPVRRVRRHFEFPKLDKRGVYVIDFIGNGRASRALIRKGKLHYIVRTGVAGQVFNVLDEQNKLVPNASLWLAGVQYLADKDGTITTPFSNEPGKAPIVLSVDEFSSLEHFDQQQEKYHLAAAMHIDREELIARRKAQLIVRARLSLSDTMITTKVLEDVRLVITSTDLDNVTSTKEVADFRIFEDRESTYEIQVPQRLASIGFQLRAKVQNQSQHKKDDLSQTMQFTLNEIDRTDKTEDLHFARVGEDYVIDLLGKTGEPKPGRPLQMQFHLRDYKQSVPVSLQTSAGGRVMLGPLSGATSIMATSPQGVSHTWEIRRDERRYPRSIHAQAGGTIEVPYMGLSDKPDRADVSLLELRGDAFTADRFGNLSMQGGLLLIDKLPPGDYSLVLKRDRIQMHLKLTAGVLRKGYVLGDYRKLEIRNPHPLQIKPVTVGEDTVRIELQNATPLARVHVMATRFEPAYSTYRNLQGVGMPEPRWAAAPAVQSQYVAGRDIGEEYRYIIDRKFARKFPGNMLERPSLLLNPWAIRGTETGQQQAQDGDEFSRLKEMTAMGGVAASDSQLKSNPRADFADLDFLANSSLVLTNLTPDKDGVIELKRSALGPHQQLVFVAVDPQNTVSRIVSLPESKNEFIDLRLAKSLDPKQHFTQRKQIRVLDAKQELAIADVTSTRFETCDSLPRVYALYAALNGDAKLAEFGFIRTWPSLKASEKQALYLKFASHELHFFLFKKDRKFFDQAVRPYLANKKEKQFLDRWLLEEELDDYLLPWNFEQLNSFERILLGQRVKGEQAGMLRLVQDQFDVLPRDPERLNKLFETALKGSSLDTEDHNGTGKFAFGLRVDTLNLELPMEADVSRDLEKAVLADAPEDRVSGAPAAEPAAAPPAKKPAALNEGKKNLEMQRKVLEKGSYRNKDAKEQLDENGPADDTAKLGQLQQYYRKLDKTMEWVESNYYKLPLDQQNSGLITANAFWRDYAAHDPAKPFYSTNLADATHSFPEMLMALALLDLPFEAAKHETQFKGVQMTLTAGSPLVVYYEELRPSAKVAENTAVLVSQNFFRAGERFRQVGGEQVDRFVSEEFLVDTVYGAHVVVTNPGSSKKKVDVLLQIPAGALPVSGGRYTRSMDIDLEPYHTQTLEYFFYFPATGKYPHYPVQVAGETEVLAFAAPLVLNVVKQLTNIDKQSWEYVSQYGSDEDVLAFLRDQNLQQVNLERIAWRMREKALFKQATRLLASRHVYNHVLWSYGVKHDDVPALREFLQFAGDFVNQSGEWLVSPLLTIDPRNRKTHEHMDYRPLVNPRVGQLGRKREILNDRFLAQYQRLLKILSYRRQLDDANLMAVTYYLLLQDRIEEALDTFARVDAARLETRLQYDYFAAYLNFYKAEPKLARQVAAKYAEYPVERWRAAFVNIMNQADEIGKLDVQVADKEDRTQVQTQQAAAAPSLEFTVEGRQVALAFQNLKQVQVNYYLMDVELLFSRNPFVQGEAKQFSLILPNLTQTVKLPKQAAVHKFELPEQLASSNVLVEIVGEGAAQSKPYYSNALRVQMIENYGQVRVTHGDQAAPLSKVYLKVYARMQGGAVRFYKDGYTDLRGRFDYSSLSTDELDHVEKFSLLILSEEHGAVVREAKPPKR